MKIIGFYENRKVRRIKNKIDFAEETASKIISDKAMTKNTVMILGSLLYIQNSLVLADSGVTTPLDNLGFRVLGIIQGIGYWVCLIMCIKEIIKSVYSGGQAKDVGSIIIKYLVVFGSLHFVPRIFDEIPACLNN